MWNKRFYLLLLKSFQDGQKRYLTKKEYGDIITHGVGNVSFFLFACRNWNLWSILLLSLEIRLAPKEGKAFDPEQVKYEHYEMVEIFDAIEKECTKEELIEVKQGPPITVRLRYHGRQFVKFTPFYRSLITINGPVWVTVGGFVALLYGFHKPVVDFFTSLFSR